MDELKKYLPLVGLIGLFTIMSIYLKPETWISTTAWSVGLGFFGGILVGVGVFLYCYEYKTNKIEPADWSKVMEAGLIAMVVITNLLLIASILSGMDFYEKYSIPASLFTNLSRAVMLTEVVLALLIALILAIIKMQALGGIKLAEIFTKVSATPTPGAATTGGGGKWILWATGGIIILVGLIALGMTLKPHQHDSVWTEPKISTGQEYQQVQPRPGSKMELRQDFASQFQPPTGAPQPAPTTSTTGNSYGNE